MAAVVCSPTVTYIVPNAIGMLVRHVMVLNVPVDASTQMGTQIAVAFSPIMVMFGARLAVHASVRQSTGALEPLLQYGMVLGLEPFVHTLQARPRFAPVSRSVMLSFLRPEISFMAVISGGEYNSGMTFEVRSYTLTYNEFWTPDPGVAVN